MFVIAMSSVAPGQVAAIRLVFVAAVAVVQFVNYSKSCNKLFPPLLALVSTYSYGRWPGKGRVLSGLFRPRLDKQVTRVSVITMLRLQLIFRNLVLFL
jgi:hypothetical protein